MALGDSFVLVGVQFFGGVLMISFATALASGALWVWSSVVWWDLSKVKSPFKLVGQRGAVRIVVADAGEAVSGNMFNGLDWDPVEVDQYYHDQSRLNTKAAVLSAIVAGATCITTILRALGL
ncbi:hypothetical protein [Devosia sp. 2618]|uniref:hypothetical protein n=1 Tax=Devosia sp. 2618 TaxID=3156454 RepID=UPI003391A2FD